MSILRSVLQPVLRDELTSPFEPKWGGEPPVPPEWRPVVATGGTVADIVIGGRTHRLHTFLTSGNFQVTDRGTNAQVRRLIAGAGASGGHHNATAARPGPGAGGDVKDDIVPVTEQTYAFTVGAGGAPAVDNNPGNDGTASSAFGETADPGAGGGTHAATGQPASTGNGRDGVNGGGAGASSADSQNPTGGVGTRNGGNGFGSTSNANARASGGAAGPGTAGGDAVSGVGGKGGDGKPSDITGSTVYYGAGAPGISTTPGATGLGGVAAPANPNAAPNAGVDGLGSGGTACAGPGAAVSSGAGGDGGIYVLYPIDPP